VRADPALIHRSDDRKKNMQTTIAKLASLGVNGRTQLR